MKTFKILNTKNFMTKLLSQTVFDEFRLESAIITTAFTCQIDGHIHKEFYPAEQASEITEDFAPFHAHKNIIFQMIRGKNTPLSFTLVLHLAPQSTASLLAEADCGISQADIRGLVMTVRFDGSQITCTTGTSLSFFTLDKTLEQAWDHKLPSIFSDHQIEFEEL